MHCHRNADHLNRPLRMTDGSMNVVWDAVYKPFGEVHAIGGSASLNLRFPGQYFLLEHGLAYNWHRYYDPTLGRYTRPDPLGLVDGPSVYAYAGSSPAMYVDPTGQFWKRLVGRYAGQAASAIARYCFGKGGLLNSNRYFRIGYSRRRGDWVFRVAGEWVPGGKIDIYTVGPIRPIKKPPGPPSPPPP